MVTPQDFLHERFKVSVTNRPAITWCRSEPFLFDHRSLWSINRNLERLGSGAYE